MRIFSQILVVAILASCGFRDHAGGSGMEIPNTISLVALQSNGSPAVNARVRIVAESKWYTNTSLGVSIVLDSMLTDKKGRFTVPIPDSELVRIEIISNGEGTSQVFDSTQKTVSLNALGSIRAEWTPGATVMIAGTSFSQKVDESGVVLFTSIPRMNTALIGQENGQKPVILSTLQIIPYDTLELDTIQVVSDSLILDDFELSSNVTMLQPFVHRSYWFSIADEKQGGNSTIYPSTANQDAWSLAISDSSAFNGKSLTIHYSIDSSSITGPYAIFGCTLGNGINGSAIDSIVFMANSNAPFIFSDGSHLLIKGDSTSSTEWHRFAVYRSDLDSLGILSKIDHLQFTFNDSNGSVFRLDDFVIYGDPFKLLQVE